MGFLSQIRQISFPPRPIDLLVVQVGMVRDWVTGLDQTVLPSGLGIPAIPFTSPSFGSVTGGFNITANVAGVALPSVKPSPIPTIDQVGTATTKGYAPIPVIGNGGAFGNTFLNNVLVWTIPTAVFQAYNNSVAPGSSPAFHYEVRGYMFVNLSLFKKKFPGQQVVLKITESGTTYSDYLVWAEVMTGVHGATFNGSLKGFGGTGFFDSKAMGFPYQNQTNWLQALGTPAKTLSVAVMSPVFSLTCDPTSPTPSYKLSCTGSGFASNCPFSVKQGNGTTGEP